MAGAAGALFSHTPCRPYLPVNWAQCVLCQRDTREKLQCPANSIGINKTSGYESFAALLLDYCKTGSLPPSVVISQLDTDGGLLEVFRSNKAKWHRSCRAKFNPRELQRKFPVLIKQVLTVHWRIALICLETRWEMT